MGATKKKPKQQKRAAKQEELHLGETPTLAEMVRWYVVHWAPEHLRERTLKARQVQLARAVRELPEYPTSGDIHAWLAGRVRRGELAASSANLWLKTLGAVYRQAKEHKWPLLLIVPAAVKPFPVPKLKPKALEDPEGDWRKCLAACRDVRERAFLSVMRECGLRPGEALGLEPGHVDLGRGVLEVAQQRATTSATPGLLKTDASAGRVKMPPETVELMRQVLADHRARQRGLSAVGTKRQRGAAGARFLFPYYTRHMEDLKARLRAAVPEGFKKREVGERGGEGFHVLRHTFATDLANRGLRTEDLHLLLRHKHMSTTALYVGSIRGREMPVDALERAWAAREAEKSAVLLPGEGAGNTTGSVSDVNTRGK